MCRDKAGQALFKCFNYRAPWSRGLWQWIERGSVSLLTTTKLEFKPIALGDAARGCYRLAPRFGA